MNTFEQEKTDLKNADGEIKNIAKAYRACAINRAMAERWMRERGAFEAEIVELIGDE